MQSTHLQSAMADRTLGMYVSAITSTSVSQRFGTSDEQGEGVISTGIAVLIMAALGALMWAGFQELWTNASTQTAEQITQIGR